jgi:hypothetical protein
MADSDQAPWQAESKLATRGSSISGLVVEYIVAIDVTRIRFLADALFYSAAGYSAGDIGNPERFLPGKLRLHWQSPQANSGLNTWQARRLSRNLSKGFP